MSHLFPHIETIDDMLPHIKDRAYISVNQQDNGSSIICYNISNNESFKTPVEKEARGITFDENGKILSRPLHKFFNLAERPEVQPAALDWNTMVAGFDKLDGSMITTGLFKGEFFAKSKKSFTSDVAIATEKYVSRNQKYYEFTKYCSQANLTPIFEFTSPKHRIVLRYDDDNMTLLHVRYNFTGDYMMPDEKERLARMFDIPVNKPLFGGNFNITSLLKSLNTVEGIEGYVIQFNNGEMVKIKTKWYMSLHHAVNFVRERDIARLVVEEKLDDYIAYISLNSPLADLSNVYRINDAIKADIEVLAKKVDEIAETFKNVDLKTAAIQLKGHKYFGFIMGAIRGHKNDYLSHYSKNRLVEAWSLEQIDLGDLSEPV